MEWPLCLRVFGHVNDPELDAELVLTVLSNQFQALSTIDGADPEIARAYHFLTTTGSRPEGSGEVFANVNAIGLHHKWHLVVFWATR